MSSGAEEAVGGEALVSYNRRPRTYRPGRLCRHPGCTTRLSIYNADDFCASHIATELAARQACGADIEEALSSV
jgi:hypothetical protein